MTQPPGSRAIETAIPARLVLVGLGTVWILDGFQITTVGTIAPATYVAGASAGAQFFGWLIHLVGRKKLFLVTLGVYLAAAHA